MLSGGTLVASAALATAGSPAATPPEFNAKCGDLDCRVEVRKTPWELLEVNLDMSVVKLAYETGGCWRGNADGTLAEGASGIRIAVYQQRVVAADTPDGKLPCTDDVEYGIVRFALKKRVAGRRLTGGPRVRGHARGFARQRSARVPRVLDLWAGDARRALLFQSFRVRHIGNPNGTVAFQSPLPAKPAHRTTVRLTMGRDWFDAHQLERCLEVGGIPTYVRRPKPGDADSPDLVLWTRHASAQASVALYADPARARDNEPAIRRTAERFNGVVERRRYVTISWYTQPPADLAARTRQCVYGKLGRPRGLSRAA